MHSCWRYRTERNLTGIPDILWIPQYFDCIITNQPWFIFSIQNTVVFAVWLVALHLVDIFPTLSRVNRVKFTTMSPIEFKQRFFQNLINREFAPVTPFAPNKRKKIPFPNGQSVVWTVVMVEGPRHNQPRTRAGEFTNGVRFGTTFVFVVKHAL